MLLLLSVTLPDADDVFDSETVSKFGKDGINNDNHWIINIYIFKVTYSTALNSHSYSFEGYIIYD